MIDRNSARALRIATLAAAAISAGCGASEPSGADPAASQLLLRELPAERSGIDFVHVTGATGDRELPETMGAGVAALDADGDGDQDLYFVQSGPLRTPGDAESRAGAENVLFLNDGAARFERAAGTTGVGDIGYGQGVAAGDADGDGRADLAVLNWGPNALLLQRERGFERSVDSAYPPGDGWTTSGIFSDVDGDGDLDLYEVNYLISPPAAHLDPQIHADAPQPFALYPHPDIFAAGADRLLINDGAGGFTDEAEQRGAAVPGGKGLGVIATDVELDGWPDLYVTNDSTPNFLLHNLGGGRFEDIGRASGVAFNDDGMTEAGMGCDTADIDVDGDLDLFVTNLDVETNTLSVNVGDPDRVRFRDQTRRAGLARPSRPWVGFGTLFGDLDLDGIQDLIVVNGHIIDNVAELSDTRRFEQPDQLFRGLGDGRFTELDCAVTAPGFERPTSSRGLARADLDGDGLPDWIVTNSGAAPRVFLGVGDASDVRRVALEGPPGNLRGLGATLLIEYADGGRQAVRIERGGSYASSSEPTATLARAASIRAIEVLWPGGERTVLE